MHDAWIVLFLEDVIVLFGQRSNVEMYNMECLTRHYGDYVTYPSTDSPSSGSRRLFDKFLADKVMKFFF